MSTHSQPSAARACPAWAVHDWFRAVHTLARALDDTVVPDHGSVLHRSMEIVAREVNERSRHHGSYSVDDVARLWGVSERTVQEHARRGHLPGTKVRGEWRFPQQEILDTLFGPDATRSAA